jgi:hypothetical protein
VDPRIGGFIVLLAFYIPFTSSQAVDKYIVCGDNGESDFEAAGIAPKGKTNPAFAGQRAEGRVASWSFCCASGLIKVPFY